MLFREGDAADRFFLIRSGAVALEIAAPGRERAGRSRRSHDGDVVGWSWLFPPLPLALRRTRDGADAA